MNEILNAITLVLAVLFAIMMVVAVTMSLWMPAWFRLSHWLKIRNKRLSDYDIHGGPGSLMAPLIDGLIDSDFYWAVDGKAWHHNEIDERLLITSKLSNKLKRRIQDRYAPKGMRNAYDRGLETLRNYQHRRVYYEFDGEFDGLYEKAMELKKDNCLKCDDQGGTWEPPGAAAQGFAPCDCKNAHRSFFN